MNILISHAALALAGFLMNNNRLPNCDYEWRQVYAQKVAFKATKNHRIGGANVYRVHGGIWQIVGHERYEQAAANEAARQAKNWVKTALESTDIRVHLPKVALHVLYGEILPDAIQIEYATFGVKAAP
jgi:hypothetical protein